MKIRTVLVSFICLVILSCCASQKDAPMEQWLKMEMLIDGQMDVQLLFPPAKIKAELLEPQFVSTVPDPIQTVLFASYDPGWGRDRDLLLTRITATIVRIEKRLDYDSSFSLEDIKNEVYLSRDDASKEFEIVGDVVLNGRPWLRVNLISGYRRGISYSTIIGGRYALIVSMSMYGEDSDQKSLFSTRHDTLRKVVNSVKVGAELNAEG